MIVVSDNGNNGVLVVEPLEKGGVLGEGRQAIVIAGRAEDLLSCRKGAETCSKE